YMGGDIPGVKRECVPGGEPQTERRPEMSRITLSILALVVASGCSGTDATGPTGRDVHPGIGVSADQSSGGAPIEISFIKWIAGYPAMAGNTSWGNGTYSGRILRRTAFDNGVIV